MAVILLLLLLLTGYTGWHLWMLPPVAWMRWTLVGVEAACVAMAVFSLTRYLDRVPYGLAVAVYNAGNKGLVVIFYLFLFFLAADLLRLLHVLPTAWIRDSWVSTGVLSAAMALLFVYASLHYEHKRRVELTIDTHGKVDHPVKVLAVSDLHLGYHNRRADLDRWVAMLNHEGGDMLLMAGDLIDRSMRPLLHEDMAEGLGGLQMPVYACLGNHEYYAAYYSPGEVEQFYSEAGITLLRDTVVNAGDVDIAGRDDRTNSRRKGIDEFVFRPAAFAVLLDHQPYHLEEAGQAGVDLQISGHTHRGQIWPLSWITDALYECSWGELRKGATTYYVSSGLGIWGAKYRIGTQSEYVVINLMPGTVETTGAAQ
ncbi:MAG: Ser/Thr protein phosphatase family protein [bacterium P3]|nr:MAG: Ser/Thr protein phosphatase family protein [bacterium P3]KWW39034.1 MAG: Ser/Thr protein phosphatase family protein [bacterium F083]